VGHQALEVDGNRAPIRFPSPHRLLLFGDAGAGTARDDLSGFGRCRPDGGRYRPIVAGAVYNSVGTSLRLSPADPQPASLKRVKPRWGPLFHCLQKTM
jgi:hypothetical protein